MTIFIYSDESGVLDKLHNDYYVFGGLMFLSKDERDAWSRRYINAEKTVRSIEKLPSEAEAKAALIRNSSKVKLYRSLNRAEKFGIVISQQGLHDKLFSNKKTKQRYLDWAFKMAVKTKFERMIEQEKIDPDEVTSLCFFVDEHTTATNGRYELREALEQEFKFGTYNGSWSIFYPPIFKNLQTVTLEYCNSATKTLIRSADIVANHIFYLARSANGKVEENDQLSLFFHP